MFIGQLNVLLNAAVVSAPPHPQTALSWGPTLYITFSFTTEGLIQMTIFYLTML